MKMIFIIVGILLSSFTSAQLLPEEVNVSPPKTFSNVHVHQIKGDSNYTAFLIWIKKEVKPHHHQFHTEIITVLEGKAMMTMNNQSFMIKKGDVLVIPEYTVHSVINKHKKPLKVLSVQTPWFDGTDRVMK